jgi:hypothetical protein
MEKQYKNLDERIKDLLKEGPLVALYFDTGITVLKEKIDGMSDEEISKMFENLLHPEMVRNNIRHIYNKMNNLN